MLTDIEIAQQAEMEPIKNVAAKLGMSEDDIEMYGKYKAKISDEYMQSVKNNENGKLILNPSLNVNTYSSSTFLASSDAFGKSFASKAASSVKPN